jgi:transposase InsO family protein
MSALPTGHATATRPNELWSMDFVSDALFDGRRLRALTVVDAYTREALAIEVDQGIKGEQVVEVMTRLAVLRGAPSAIRVDNVLSWEARVDFGQAGLVAPCHAGRRGDCDPSGLHRRRDRSLP